mgnify:CR=1 FL=1
MSVSKGDRVKIVRGRKGKGVTGKVFWLGPDKFDAAKTKAGVHGDDGQKYWVDASYLTATTEEQAPPPVDQARVAKGDRVTWREGHDAGEGVCFWIGPSKHGPGLRVGVDVGGAKRFLALPDVQKVEPYTLYGAEPAQWTRPDHLLARSIDLRFVRAPSDAERDAIGERVHADLRPGTPVLRSRTELWLPLAADNDADAVAAAGAWLDDLDAIVALVDAVYLSAAPTAFGEAVTSSRPEWVGLLRTGGDYLASSVDQRIEAVRASHGP